MSDVVDLRGPLRIGLLAAPWVAVPPKSYGGSELVIDALARGLAELGHDVELFTTADSTSPIPQAHLFDRADPDRMGATVLELRHVAAAYDRWGRDRFDVIHDHTLAGVFYRHRPEDVPIVTTLHGPFDDDLTDLYRRMSVDVSLIAISRDQASQAGDTPIHSIVHHGLMLADYPPGPGGDGLLFLGRMDPQKGVHIAARAAREAGIPLTIAAKMRRPEEKRYFEHQVRPLLGGDIRFIGEADRRTKVHLLRSSLALINPICWSEPFGLVMIEALACGTPVLGFPNGAAPEIVDHGTTGFLVRTEEELVARISDLRDLHRPACRAAVEERFTAQRMAQEHVEIYRKVMQLLAVDARSAAGGRPTGPKPLMRQLPVRHCEFMSPIAEENGIADPAEKTTPSGSTTHHIGPIKDCPGCQGTDFLVHRRGEAAVFRCLACGSSWRYELGYVWSVPEPDATP